MTRSITWGRSVLGMVSMGLAFSTMGAACFFDRDDEQRQPTRECESDTQCGHLNSDDACFGNAYCDDDFSCRVDFLQDDDRCQCDGAWDCRAFGYEELGCNLVSCSDDHQCSETLAPAGSSPAEREGDCADLTCDGENKEPIVNVNLNDIRDDNNSCTTDTCNEDGASNTPVADGTACGDGVCFDAMCHAGCAPSNPDSCGDEGPNEPANNDGFAATSVNEHQQSCGMLDGDDVDWFELYIVDEEFETDIIGIDVVASAPTVEICAFVLCDNGGFPGGGCGNKQQGPVGSDGCCWTGDPKTLSPTWDLDCSDTTDDSGTLFVSVRAPSGSDCESYRISAHY